MSCPTVLPDATFAYQGGGRGMPSEDIEFWTIGCRAVCAPI
uniref:Uncharacterized protein n=1 Tax=Neisseria meningitidis alpha275 TaxID=295996 RepID=C6SGQ8_NEIME|nr:hypothetical protein predicted by Glimmer/Critica [Neisseria meningitidis alpha275]